jgi:hypothetical protein
VPLHEQEQLAHPWAAMLQPLKKNQITLVNKCNKTNVNITEDINPKFIPFHKMWEASDGPKYLYKTSAKELKFTPSHLSSFSDSISFGIFLGAVSLSMSTSMDSQGFTFNFSYHSRTITGGLRLKQSLS